MAAKYLCWGYFTLTAPWRLRRSRWPLKKQTLPKQTDSRTTERGREPGVHHFTGFTPTHMPQRITQLGLHLTLDMQPTKRTSAAGWERLGRVSGCYNVGNEWQTTGWVKEAGVMDCEGEDLMRRSQGPSACQPAADSSLLSFLLSILCCLI